MTDTKPHLLLNIVSFLCILGSVLSAQESAPKATDPELRLIQHTYEIPTLLWLQIPDDMKQDHQRLLEKLNQTNKADVQLLNIAAKVLGNSEKTYMTQATEIMYPTEFFAFQNYVFPSAWETRNTGDVIEVKRSDFQTYKLNHEMVRLQEYKPSLKKGSDLNKSRSEIPIFNTVRATTSLVLPVNQTVLVSALPHPQFEKSRTHMILTFETLAFPSVVKQEKVSSPNITFELMLIRGFSTSKNSNDIIRQARKRPSSIIYSAMGSVTSGQRSTFESITELIYPTDAMATTPITPSALETRNCGVTSEIEITNLAGNTMSIKASIEMMVAPPKLPEVPGLSGNKIDLTHQFFEARFIIGGKDLKQMEIKNNQWTILKKYTPEDLLVVKEKTYLPRNAQLDSDYKKERESNYTLLIRVLPAAKESELNQDLISYLTPAKVEDKDVKYNPQINQALQSGLWRRQDLNAYNLVWSKINTQVSKEDLLEKVIEVRPFQNSFFALSKEPLSSYEGMMLASKLGAEVLDTQHPDLQGNQALIFWIQATYFDYPRRSQLAFHVDKKPTILKAFSRTNVQRIKTQTALPKSQYMFRWKADKATMIEAAKASNQLLSPNSTLEAQTLFYSGEWEYSASSGENRTYRFRRILYPDGRAELWTGGKKWKKNRDGRPVWKGFHWKIREDGALVILSANGKIDSVYKPSALTPDQVIHEDVSKTTIPIMQKAVNSWVFPEVGSREVLNKTKQ